MHRETLAKLLEDAREIAVAAGKVILAVPFEPADVTDKADGSPLTRADLASHETIVSGLALLEPKFPVLSEEGDLEAIDPEAWRTFWCVDPLDGTKEFVGGLPDYTVNIALIEAGRPVLGVIYIPALDELYYGAEGIGAFKSVGGRAPRPISASDREQPRTAVVSRSHLSPETEQFLERLNVSQTIKRGSSAKICAVADGSADIYPRFGPTCLWDTAAGTAIAREAGCRVVDLAGEDLSYDVRKGLKRPGFIVHPARLRLPA